MALTISAYQGPQINTVLEDLAALRIRVFAEWPYLYAGDMDYERDYLQAYVDCPHSLALLVLDGSHPVAASTGLPLAAAPADMRQPFADKGKAIEEIFYCAESVVLPSHRSQGLGSQFFARREDHARSLGLKHSVFCAVHRDPEDPRRPQTYQGNESFWSRRGYSPLKQTACRFEWTDIGHTQSSEKTLNFWHKQLADRQP